MPHPRHAFTLLELLLAVTIISLLMALLLPLFGTLRAVAQQTACAANLHQIGVLELSYASAHRGTMPPAYLRPNMDWLGSNEAQIYGVHGRVWGDCWEAWYNWLGKDLGLDYKNLWGERSAFFNWLVCPSAPYKPPKSMGANAEHWFAPCSYGPNTAMLGDTGRTGANQWGFPNQHESPTGWPGYGVGIPGLRDNARQIARIGMPSQVIALAEHRGARTYLVGGGESPFAYWTDPPFVRQPVDGDGQPMTAPPSWGTPIAPFPYTAADATFLTQRISHRGRANYLFHDGRVAAMSPWDTCQADPALANLWTGTR